MIEIRNEYTYKKAVTFVTPCRCTLGFDDTLSAELLQMIEAFITAAGLIYDVGAGP
jgi:hypothetical protein